MRASEPLGTGACIDAASGARTATGLESILLRTASGAAERDARPAFPEGPYLKRPRASNTSAVCIFVARVSWADRARSTTVFAGDKEGH